MKVLSRLKEIEMKRAEVKEKEAFNEVWGFHKDLVDQPNCYKGGPNSSRIQSVKLKIPGNFFLKSDAELLLHSSYSF